MSTAALSIAEILGHEPALMPLPTFFKACGMAQSTGYQIAAEGGLPLEVIPLGRRRYVRTVDAWKFLGLTDQAAAEVESAASAEENGDGPGVEPRPSVALNQVHSSADRK